ncbi:MAG: MFS transporter [Proteobacteria bacterium]|nr:MFS transporter [Pseudomonadota bacterium]
MAAEKYLSVKERVNGFSFANLGFFSGFGGGIISAVYSLILLDIFQSSAKVGIYSAIYAAFGMLVALFSGEFFRRVSKSRLFYAGMLTIGVCYFMMAFSVAPATFITLDYVSGVPQVLVGMLIPLFMADFSKDVGIAKLNGRYHLWLNAGALVAPMVAMAIAGLYGIRSPFFAVAVIYIFGAAFFRWFGIIQEDKKFKKINPRRTIKSVMRSAAKFFKQPVLLRAYLVNFGFFALAAMRSLYVPIIVIQNGFSKSTLGLVLTLGIIPYVVLSEPIGRLARKYGTRIWLIAGFLSFAAFAFWATVATGWTLLLIFILWQISGALMEPVYDLLFFNNTKKAERARYIGIFKTSANFPKIAAPLLGAAAIFVFGMTSAVWIVTGVIALATAFVCFKK